MRALGVLLFVIAACSSAELEQAPQTMAAPCPATASVYCDAGAGGCTADPSDRDLARLPSGAYPEGCSASLFSGAREDDGTCAVSRTCVCTGSDAGAPRWVCR